jgi:excisionase family DNA binding protein
MDKPTPRLDTASAAEQAGVTSDTIRRWCRLGYLHPIRVGVGRRYRIDADELAAVIDGTAFSPGGTSPPPVTPTDEESGR